MPALAAVFMRDGVPVAADQAEGLSEALQPFGAKTVAKREGPAGLVRRMAAPFTPEDVFDVGIVQCPGGDLVAFDGMLHHRDELARTLNIEPSKARSLADSSLFARAWERWGEDVGVRAEGDFAAVAWDPASRVLTAMCSPLASPPLYFSVVPQRAVVASTPRGVHAGSGIPVRINDARLASSLILDYRDNRSTYYQGVYGLASGEILVVEPRRHRVRRYYDLGDCVRPVRLRRTEDYVEAGREVLRAAVAESLRAVETPALLLSSGLDSTAVAANALEILADKPGASPLISFTARPAEGWDERSEADRSGDEWPLARTMVAKWPSLDARFVRNQDVPFDHLWEPMMQLEQLPPRNFLNAAWGHECRHRARTAGRRVILSGRSGNATISYAGIERFATLLRGGRWRKLRQEAALSWPAEWRNRALARYAVMPLLPNRVYAASQRWRGRPGWRQYSAIHPRFASDMRVEQRARRNGFDPYFRSARSRLEGQLNLLASGQGEGRSSGAALVAFHDVAWRDPLANRRLVLWCLGVPDELYYRNGKARLLVRLLMQDRVPDEILWSPVRGRQVADWHFRLGRELPRIRAELEAWRSDPAIAERLDLTRLLRLVDTWPRSTALSSADHPDHLLCSTGFPRAIATGRFIRFVEASA